MTLPPEYYFCCLNSGERQMLRVMGEALPLTLFLGVPKDVWDAYWSTVPLSGEPRRQAALYTYQLEIATIDVGDPPVSVDVVRPADLAFWVDMSLYILTPDAACLDGCQQSTVFTP